MACRLPVGSAGEPSSRSWSLAVVASPVSAIAGVAVTKDIALMPTAEVIVTGATSADHADPAGSVTLDATSSTDPEGQTLTYTWVQTGGPSVTLTDAMRDADVFIGVSGPNLVTADMLASMADRPIVFALSNPDPEISPVLAEASTAALAGPPRR